MSLKLRIQEDVKHTMKSGNKPRLMLMRTLTAAIKQREVDERIELDDAQVLAVVDKMVKQRRESIEQFQAGNRPELAEIEQAEIDILMDFLPEPLSDEQLEALIAQAITETDASTISDMGQVMGKLKAQVQGRADMKQVSAQVRARLA